MKSPKKDWLVLGLAWVLGALFIYAGAMKIQDPQSLADSIVMFRILPEQAIDLLALLLPPFEILLGIWLLSGWDRRTASFSALALILIFTLAIGQALARGLSIHCGCFGSHSAWEKNGWVGFARDIVLLGAVFLLYQKSQKNREEV